mmetsp:Transcript_13585/g.20678  ORF Transcript_13585/g.20678 Transcript_13585/m.20678 type:complete len:374 (-) Transcript_13585:320-1441(-)
MKQITLFLIPTPGAKPEFLATVKAEWQGVQVPSNINLEGYTREPWAWKPNPNAWTELIVTSVDGRNKLPGFVKYLKERQKCAFGRFSANTVIVASYIQKKDALVEKNEMSVRVCMDMGKIENCPLYKGNKEKLAVASKGNPLTLKPKKSGILGNLLGAQSRTNNHMANVAKRKPASNGPTAAAVEPSEQPQQQQGEEARTAQQVLAEFRQKMEEEMLDFDSCSETVVKVRIVLSDIQKGLNDEDKARINMDVLQYIVYEAAEECNEEWVAHKETSEFLDVSIIAIYKEGHAPEEALEELNRVEMTEDMIGEQRAMQEQHRKKALEENKNIDAVHKKALEEDAGENGVEALNTNRRDRRTIEEIQAESNKRTRQ